MKLTIDLNQTLAERLEKLVEHDKESGLNRSMKEIAESLLHDKVKTELDFIQMREDLDKLTLTEMEDLS